MTAVPVHSALPPSLTELHLVPPGDVPQGAAILGHVIALAAEADARSVGIHRAQPARQLVAVREPVPEPPGAPEAPQRLQLAPDLELDRWGRQVIHDGRPVALTRREFELLDHLVTHAGRVEAR